MKKIILYVLLAAVISCQENQPPTCLITSPANNATFNIGDSITISVKADDPEESIKEVRIFLNESGVVSLSNFPFNYSMGTNDFQPGDYTIKATISDTEGLEDSDEISVLINATLPTVASVTLDSLTNSSLIASSNVSVDGGSEITARGFCWNTLPNPTLSNEYNTEGSGLGDFEIKIDNLLCNTEYYLRAYATNAEGTAYGGQLSFKTDICYTAPIISTSIVNQITDTSAVCGGNITHNGGANIRSRGICWSTSQGPTLLDNHTTDGPGGGTFTSDMIGLVCETTYYVRAYAVNAVDTAFGNQVVFTTNPCPGSIPIVTTTEISGITDNSALGGGNATDDGGTEIIARGVCWSISSNPTLMDNYTIDGTGTGVYTSEMSGLERGTAYFVRAYATNEIGTAYGDEVSFSTLGPPEVTTVSLTGITVSSANGGGEVDSDGGDPVSARGICWSTDPNPTTSDFLTTDGSGTGNFSSSISGLQLFTGYYVRAYATNNIGTSYGEELFFRTLWDGSTATDIDGNIYNTVAIGAQIWLAKNLGVTKYADGTAITYIEDETEWAGLTETDRAYCWYENLPGNRDSIGALYTWSAAARGDSSRTNPSGLQGVCPNGWHLPSDEEWKELEIALGMSQSDVDIVGFRGTDEGGKLKETGNNFWYGDNLGATNESGFNGRGSGIRNFDGAYTYFGLVSSIWSSTNYDRTRATVRAIFHDEMKISRNSYVKRNGYSVRCVKDL